MCWALWLFFTNKGKVIQPFSWQQTRHGSTWFWTWNVGCTHQLEQGIMYQWSVPGIKRVCLYNLSGCVFSSHWLVTIRSSTAQDRSAKHFRFVAAEAQRLPIALGDRWGEGDWNLPRLHLSTTKKTFRKRLFQSRPKQSKGLFVYTWHG